MTEAEHIMFETLCWAVPILIFGIAFIWGFKTGTWYVRSGQDKKDAEQDRLEAEEEDEDEDSKENQE